MEAAACRKKCFFVCFSYKQCTEYITLGNNKRVVWLNKGGKELNGHHSQSINNKTQNEQKCLKQERIARLGSAGSGKKSRKQAETLSSNTLRN